MLYRQTQLVEDQFRIALSAFHTKKAIKCFKNHVGMFLLAGIGWKITNFVVFKSQNEIEVIYYVSTNPASWRSIQGRFFRFST